MSKKEIKITKADYEIDGDIVHLYRVAQFSNFEGKLLTFIESLGLGEKQELAAKSIVRIHIWDLWEQPWGTDIKKSIFE